jgi:hypothetical protein
MTPSLSDEKPFAVLDKLTMGGADNNLDYLEVVHVFIRRANSSGQARQRCSQKHVESRYAAAGQHRSLELPRSAK